MHNDKKIVATVECRMTSSRLPGKVMMTSCGKPMLEHLVERLRRVERIDQIVFATTERGTDDCIEALAERLGVGCFRGSEDDVLSRVLGAAEKYVGELIVEITGDCPLIDPGIVAQTLDLYTLNQCDYAANCLVPSYPVGMDTQVFSTALLRLADREGHLPDDREHVSWFFVRNSDRFRLLMLPAPPELRWPELRLTLDEMADFELINTLFERLYPLNPGFSCADMLDCLRRENALQRLNEHVVQRHPTQYA